MNVQDAFYQTVHGAAGGCDAASHGDVCVPAWREVQHIYTTDDFPRDGCKVVVEFLDGRYMWRVYAPGFVPDGFNGLLESYFPRPMASIGIAMDAFAHGRTVRSVLSEMGQAERRAESDDSV